ncbi:translation initiation factor IF-2 [Alitiscatomonas aceti]|uniref:Translation initiation factor IF-2 n=1 Tax=Alitiscatomonas aceti TaxID=2981724 RepID=A0ABT2V1Y8_9FIRM|nr:translation initiation factor IF-2 [Alitiscatomonas aceti]MCU6800905.1 translation initiation factor IF-2 [Alitiscatomonas aceti]
MRDNDLAKNLGKTNKEVTDTLQKNNMEENSSMTNGAGTQPAGENKEGAAPAKKRIAAVYRPQNSTQKGRGGRSQGQGARNQRSTGPGMQVRPTTSAPAQKPKAAPAEEVKEQTTAPVQETETAPVQAASQTEARPQGSRQGGYNRDGQRDGNRQGGYNRDGQRDGNRQGGYNRDGQRDGNRQGGFNRDGQRDGNRQGGFNRDGQRDGNRQGGFNRDGQRDGNRQGGFNRDGQRDGNRQGGYNRDGQRDGNRQGGYNRDGQRDGNRQGGYNRDGQRDGNRQGGFNRDGQRDGNRQGGYNRDGGRQGGYGRDGQRDGNRQGGRDGRGGLNIPKPSFDTPMAQKQQNTKASKNAYKKEHDARKDRDEELRGKNAKGGKGVKAPVMQQPKKAEAKVEEIKTIVIPETITIKELAEKMKLQPSAIVKKLFLQGTIVTINQEIDFEKAEEIAMEYDVLCEKEKKINVIEELLREEEEDEKDMVSRPPVICVMGHVDHGKTSLLDAIRQSNVTSREAGGITQHIGAYVVEANGQRITFLDTPGHEAFTAMRMRGAQATDIAILVVAADDGVMPQTVEAINHAKAAGVEIIVAVNKIDKPSANVERVKQELSEYELIPEDWGGSTVFVPVSAHTKEGIPELLEMILLTAEVKELKANPNRKARGLVIEAQLDKGRGPVATVLVQKGTLKVGDSIAAGSCYGRVRAMMDDKGNRVKEAGPSTPVEILGLNDVPNAGEVFVALQNEKEARSFAETFITEGKNKLIEDTKAKLSLDDLFSQIKAGNVKELPIIVKADVQGSVEAVKQSLVKLSNEEVVVKVIHGGVGTINESDVTLASASNAIIIGFNVRPDATAKSIADREKVDMRLYRVIYQAIEDVEAAMKGMLDPVYEEQVTGHAIVRQTFKASGVGTIAGSYVLDGKITRGSKARITREGEQIFEGPLASLKRFKDDVKEVNAGYECGLVFEGFNDLKEDDMIEIYIMVEVPR